MQLTLFSYYYFGAWWYSNLGTIFILFLSYLIWGRGFLREIGLHLDAKIIVRALLLTGVILVCSFLMMEHLAGKQNVLIRSTNWRNYYHDIFYILNEEIVMGAIILFPLVRKWKIRPEMASSESTSLSVRRLAETSPGLLKSGSAFETPGSISRKG